MVVLGLGSNFGDRLSFLRLAIQKLRSYHPLIQVKAISPIYESEALLLKGAPDTWALPFLNLCTLCETKLPSTELLDVVKTIEIELGRKNRGRWAPREIDIDILARGDQTHSTDQLNIPHLNLMERPFAFLPLIDLTPDWVHPNLNLNKKKVSILKQIREQTFPIPATRSSKTLTELVGILNITPDSFSDGGKHSEPASVLSTVTQWVENGIRIVDIGAESTRPGATPISTTDEIKRLAPILAVLRLYCDQKKGPLILSLDTRNSEVAAWAIKSGIHWINDVSGLSNPTMRKVVSESTVDVVFMHSLSVPPRKNETIPIEANPIEVILEWAQAKIRELKKEGISKERLIFDPGLGFGKTTDQNWEILRGARKFQELGIRILIGHSRKSFMSSLNNLPAKERDLETAVISTDLFEKGIDFIRVHKPFPNSRALAAWNRVNGVIRCQT